MSKYDEFDLDIQKAKGIEERGSDELSILASCMPGICDTVGPTITCPKFSCMCTATQQADCSNTCSACHSYCGGVC